ncbi:hypothetical protein ACYPKM_02300 [Pseudomonas aeruginosa]
MKGVKLNPNYNFADTRKRILAAFGKLRKLGFYATINAGKSHEGALDHMGKLRSDGQLPENYLYCSQNSMKSLAEKGTTWFRWGGDGQAMVDAFQAEGLRVVWDRSDLTTIQVFAMNVVTEHLSGAASSFMPIEDSWHFPLRKQSVFKINSGTSEGRLVRVVGDQETCERVQALVESGAALDFGGRYMQEIFTEGGEVFDLLHCMQIRAVGDDSLYDFHLHG